MSRGLRYHEKMDLTKIFEVDELECIDVAKKFVKDNIKGGNKNKTTQLRKFYDIIVSLEEGKENKDKLAKLKILLVYSYARKNISKSFYESLLRLIDEVAKDTEKIKRFKEFMEAVIAYMKIEEK